MAKTLEEPHFFRKIDGIVSFSYYCNVASVTLPILLVPVVVQEYSHPYTLDDETFIASVVAYISAIATLGGAAGKFVNGFVCQVFGPYEVSIVYFVGLAACAFLFSFADTPWALGLAYAGMEFFSSMHTTSLAVMLSDYYETAPPAKLTHALTLMGLASTSGQLSSMGMGVALASTFHWRVVARMGAVTALLGGLCITRAPKTEMPLPLQAFSFASVKDTLKRILGNFTFWLLAVAYGLTFVAGGVDRILGTFYRQVVPSLPTPVCGGLTLSITLGLMHGLVADSQTFTNQPHEAAKKRFLSICYVKTVLATVGLAVVAFGDVAGWLPPSIILRTTLIAVLSAYMASNIAFQYYQFPPMIARSMFAEDKAVCISLLDGAGFLLSAPIFAVTSQFIPAYGWSYAWIMFAGFFAISGVILVQTLGPVLQNSNDDEDDTMDYHAYECGNVSAHDAASQQKNTHPLTDACTIIDQIPSER
jgi:MFS family permease